MSKTAPVVDFAKFTRELRKEQNSPRATAILTLAHLDTVLESALRAVLLDARPVHELFDGQRALATSSAKIDLAFGLGLISDITRRDLHGIRKIRNHFAHEIADGSFDAEPARSFIRGMSVYPFAEAIMQSARKPVPPTRLFDMMCTMLIGFVEAETSGPRRKRPKERMGPHPIPIPTQEELKALHAQRALRRTRRKKA